jgi:uncharacterized lipoprotein
MTLSQNNLYSINTRPTAGCSVASDWASDRKLKDTSIQELIEIMKSDYGVTINEKEAEQFGLSLLRMTRIAKETFVKANTSK